MSGTRSRYSKNNLELSALDDHSLCVIRQRLRQAIAEGVTLVETHRSRNSSIYTGDTGIAVMYLRLEKQSAALKLEDVGDLRQLAKIYLRTEVPIPRDSPPRPGRLSPVDSLVGLATTRILSGVPGSIPKRSDIDSIILAIEAVEKDTTRTNEVLYGKAGLLFALLQLRGTLSHQNDDEHLVAVTNDEILGYIIDVLIDEGTSAASSQTAPLHFEWHGKCYLGAMHGLAGILTVLLQCPSRLIEKHRVIIVSSISWLIELVLANDGVLPSSLPVHHREEPLVQICHGSPGLLLLLATAQNLRPEWVRELEIFDKVINLASDHIWEQGLLTKGLGVCHGVTGNAWPWLLMAIPGSSQPEGHDINLSRALAFLLHSTELPPMTSSQPSPYRTPDHPYSMFEGLAGAISCWSEACAVISAILKDADAPILGMPCIGGVGITGML